MNPCTSFQIPKKEKSVEYPLQENCSKVLLRRRIMHPPNPVSSTHTQPMTVVTGALLVTVNAVPVASVHDACAPGPLPGCFDPDILGGGTGRLPALVVRGQGVPNADGVVQTEIDSVADLVYVETFDGLEGVRHECRDPFGERGAGLNEGGRGLPELATSHPMAQGDVERE